MPSVLRGKCGLILAREGSFFARRGLSNLNENREKVENRKDEKEKTLHYEGESTKNSVVCGAAGVEFALELCVGSSDAVWNALAFVRSRNVG